MALCAGDGARCCALRNNDCPVVCIGLVRSRYIVRRRVLSGTVDHVLANRRRLCAVKRHGKRRHAAFLEGSIEHNAVPGINGDERGPAKIWDNAAGHRVFRLLPPPTRRP